MPAQARVTLFLILLIALFSTSLGAESVFAGSSDRVSAVGAPPRAAKAPVIGAAGLHFVGSARCGTCHAAESRHWTGSDHDLALVEATPRSVLGDFSGAVFEEGRDRFRFVRDGDRYIVERTPVGAPQDAPPERHTVAFTIGVKPLQQYLIEAPSGRLQSLTVAWDTTESRWFSLHEGPPPPPGDALHWQGRYYSWNTQCADCHGTRIDRGYDLASDTYATTWAEINVGCEACHGPGSAHTERAEARARGGAAPAYSKAEFVVDAVAESSHMQVDACGRCHSRRRAISEHWQHGDSLFDHYEPATLDQGLYFADGQIRDEVYVYGSFTQSRMHAAGVRCTDCHDAHSLGLVASGNDLCTRCHSTASVEPFAALARGVYDDPSHHHHEPGQPGAQCVDCHMPARTYMKVDPRRDHKLSVPRPDLSLKLGTPNACTGCHESRGDGWAMKQVEKLWGAPEPRPDDFATVFHDARDGDPASLPKLEAIFDQQDAPAIVRATAVRIAGSFGLAAVGMIDRALHDPDPWVRTTAVEAAGAWPPRERIPRVVPLLNDPVRSVRLGAARALASFAPDDAPAEVQIALAAAVGELETALAASGGHPGNRLNLAVLAQGRGDLALAEAEYRKALELDVDFIPARLNLVHLLDAQGRTLEAVTLLREGLATTTGAESGDMEYALGLVLAQEGDLSEAATHLERAATLMPNHPRVHYNLGLARQQLGDAGRARPALEAAVALAPGDPSMRSALAIFFTQQGDWKAARVQAEALLRLTPGDPSAEALLLRIDREETAQRGH